MKTVSLRCIFPLVALTVAACQSPPEPSPPTLVEKSWATYQDRSDYWRSVDQDFIKEELQAIGQNEQALPKKTIRFGFDVNQPAAWYATSEGERVADIIVSFQTPSGGWSKRTDMAHEKRQPGEAFGVERKYVPTFDNDATVQQLKVLARAYEATGKPEYANAFVRGVNLIIDAQYPNGCWPQIYPLAGGYHDLATFNDDVIANNLQLLHAIVLGENEFDFVAQDVRRGAQETLELGLNCVVDTQIQVNGKPTIWGAQYDRDSLRLAWARAFEMPALATGESANLLGFLMTLDNPSPEIVDAIHAAAVWYEANQVHGLVWDATKRITYKDPAAGPIWARFVEPDSGRPVFGDRDGELYYDVMEVSEERRRGYGWYNTSGLKVLKQYAKWRERFPQSQRL